MANYTRIELTPEDPIFSEGPTSFVPWSPKSTPASQNATAGATLNDPQVETEADGIRAEARLAPTPASSRLGLRAAYLATDFVFEAEGRRYTLRVGEQNAQVRDLLAKHGAKGVAYITAYNPASLQLGEVHNTLAMRALRRDLKASAGESSVVYKGAGQDRVGQWPPEPSLVVLGAETAAGSLVKELRNAQVATRSALVQINAHMKEQVHRRLERSRTRYAIKGVFRLHEPCIKVDRLYRRGNPALSRSFHASQQLRNRLHLSAGRCVHHEDVPPIQRVPNRPARWNVTLQ